MNNTLPIMEEKETIIVLHISLRKKISKFGAMATNIQKYRYFLVLSVMLVWVYFVPMQLGPIENLGLTFSNQVLAKNKNGRTVFYGWERIKHNEKLDQRTSIKIPINDIKEVPNDLIGMLLNQEDKSFYSNFLGINVKGLIRALLGGSGGGSGICQQTVKNIFFTTDDGEKNNIKNLNRKFAEVLLSLNFSRHYSKDDILRTYLNNFYVKSVPEWGDLYGLKLSAKYHFGKELKDLNMSEMAVLVKYINKPNIYINQGGVYFKKTTKNNLKPFEKLFAENKITEVEYKRKVIEYRRNFVLKNYFENGKITKGVYEKEIVRPLEYKDNTDFLLSDIGLKNIRGIMKKVTDEKNKVLDKNNVVRTTGLKIYTTIDVNLQKAIESVYIVENNTWKNNPMNPMIINGKDSFAIDYLQCGVFSIDKITGGVNAMLDGRLDKVLDWNNYCFTNRQAGSIFKLFDYYTLFEQNPELTPASLLPDKRIGKFSYPKSHTKNQDVSIREAISYSSNIVPYNLIYGNYISKDRLARVASVFKVNINDINSMATLIGQDEVNLAQMVNAYNSISNEGTVFENYYIEKITNRQGKVLYERANNNNETTLNTDVCIKLKQCFNGVIQGNSSQDATAHFIVKETGIDRNNINYGGKTGTTDNAANLWYIGYTPRFTLGIWQGFSLGNRSQGELDGSYCARLWTKIYNKYNGK